MVMQAQAVRPRRRLLWKAAIEFPVRNDRFVPNAADSAGGYIGLGDRQRAGLRVG